MGRLRGGERLRGLGRRGRRRAGSRRTGRPGRRDGRLGICGRRARVQLSVRGTSWGPWLCLKRKEAAGEKVTAREAADWRSGCLFIKTARNQPAPRGRRGTAAVACAAAPGAGSARPRGASARPPAGDRVRCCCARGWRLRGAVHMAFSGVTLASHFLRQILGFWDLGMGLLIIKLVGFLRIPSGC